MDLRVRNIKCPESNIFFMKKTIFNSWILWIFVFLWFLAVTSLNKFDVKWMDRGLKRLKNWDDSCRVKITELYFRMVRPAVVGVQLVAAVSLGRRAWTEAAQRSGAPSAVDLEVGGADRKTRGERGVARLSRVPVWCRRSRGTLSASSVSMWNLEHSAHLRQNGERSWLLGKESNNLGDGSAKNCGGRAQIDHASDSITPWMDGGDSGEGSLGWRRELAANEHYFAHGYWRRWLCPLPARLQSRQVLRRPPLPELLGQLAD